MKKRSLLIFLAIATLLAPLAFAESDAENSTGEFILSGKVMDTDDNWLNDAEILLDPVGVKTTTDPNGDFSLKFTLARPLKPNKRGFIARVTVRKEGHDDRIIRVKSMDFFSAAKPLVAKLKPVAVEESIIGFTVEMDMANAAMTGKGKAAEAEFHVYIPESVGKVKAALYLSRHGIGNVTHPVLQKFAEEESVALVGMYGAPVQRGVKSVDILDEHMRKLAELSGHPELPEAPIMTFGHSNGTGFATCWPSQRPEQVIAWVSFRPGFTNYLQFPNLEKIPAMVLCGSVDKYFLNSRQDEVVKDLRKTRQAAISTMLESGVGHGPADHDRNWEFLVEFYKAAMKLRLGANGKLKPVVIDEGWLGETYDVEKGGRQLLDIAPYAEFKGDKSTANWFPGEAFAKVWQSYGKTEPVKP